jgi:hypothetical protein
MKLGAVVISRSELGRWSDRQRCGVNRAGSGLHRYCRTYGQRLRPGDVLVITKLDRLRSSVRNLIELAAVLAERGVDPRVLDQGIDTSTPGGKLTFHILGAIASSSVT